MSRRLRLEPHVSALIRALDSRLEGLGRWKDETKDGLKVYTIQGEAFLQIEVKRDHMNVDVWLDEDNLAKARSSGIARAHPFLGEDAVKVRFERAEDLARVARWIEVSYGIAKSRAQ